MFSYSFVLLATAWLIYTTVREFTHRQYPRPWKASAIVLALLGVGLAIWLLTRENTATTNTRLIGFPFAVGGYELINGRWIGSLVAPHPLLATTANIFFGIALGLLPLRIAQLTKR